MTKRKFEHTKGNWIAVGCWVEHPDDEVADICDCNPASMGQEHFGRTYREITANARLIAAAPDLLAVLQAIVSNGAHCNVEPHLYAAASAAIAKATEGAS